MYVHDKTSIVATATKLIQVSLYKVGRQFFLFCLLTITAAVADV